MAVLPVINSNSPAADTMAWDTPTVIHISGTKWVQKYQSNPLVPSAPACCTGSVFFRQAQPHFPLLILSEPYKHHLTAAGAATKDFYFFCLLWRGLTTLSCVWPHSGSYLTCKYCSTVAQQCVGKKGGQGFFVHRL